MNLASLYANRFDAADLAWKREVWAELWAHFFSRYITPGDTLVDLGAGYCELVNVARAKRKIAVDLREDLASLAAPGVETRQVPAHQLDFLRDGEADVVFTSNFLEHLPDKATLTAVAAEVKRVLKPGGLFIIVGPNVRLLPGRYWDYFDHQLPLTERSVSELLTLSGFELSEVVARFLPYTLKSSAPRWRGLVRAYLALRPAWKVFGKQFLVVART